MHKIERILPKARVDSLSRAKEKYSKVGSIKRRKKAIKLLMLPFFPILFLIRVFQKLFGKVVKMKTIGFPFRYLRVVFRIVSFIKRIEELERMNHRLEVELKQMKKQWFSGKTV